MLETRRHRAEVTEKDGVDCRDLLEIDSIRTEILNFAHSEETSARLSLGEKRVDGSSS